MLTRLVLATLFLAACLASALAAPARIIILRHGEKADDWKLCAVGVQRAEALARNYLGRGAAKSLFNAGEEPAALYAITLHTLQLLSPAAATWDKPIALYSAVPEPGQTPGEFTEALNRRTQEAARHVLTDPALAGKTIVMVWEHHHIADAALEAKFPGEKVTLRQLLKLDTLPNVPDTWPTETYDYFWIVDFARSGTPAKFSMLKQEFGASFPGVPSNDWGKPDGLTAASGCETKPG
jgi:hypothetical protein